MNTDPNYLISGHLDCSLTQDEQMALNDWIKADSVNADRFVRAVMLHNRIHSQYQLLSATVEHLDNLRTTAVPPRRHPARLVMIVSAACLLLAVGLHLGVPKPPSPAVSAVAEFHELITHARKPLDRTYRVTFVKEQPTGNVDQAMLYIRGGREFVYRSRSIDGRETIIGRNRVQSWSIRNDHTVEENGDPLHFTGGLPGGNGGIYLSPILNLFEGQEKVLIADYNLEVHHPTKTTSEFIAAKKPDSTQGPHRIAISFSQATAQISQMRIWPETLDHRKTEFTLIELASEEALPEDWFTPRFHLQVGQKPVVNSAQAAD